MRVQVILILFLSFFSAYSQEARISGIIQSAEDGSFVTNAQVLCNDHSLKVETNGSFSALLPVNKLYILKIKHKDYKFLYREIFLLKDTALVFFLNAPALRLDEVVITSEKDNKFGISRLNNVEGTTIYAGKKSEAVYLEDLNANLAANNSRQIFSKVPGINIFENDGSGTTIGIGGRGLNPNRISNFNTRQNGYDISADALGYPESYYTPPTEAVERIEILRGAAGLQFGTQFGGMINYKFREAPLDKKISGNFRQTGGSYGFLNSFNQLSGTVNKWSYNTFYQFKQYKGWRSRSELNSHNAFAGLQYRVNEKLTLKGEYTFLNYISQQPGGLSDAMFKKDNSQVTRHRNWFKVNWNLVSFNADYKLNDWTRIDFLSFGLLAGRDALGVLTPANRADDTSTFRNLLKDVYNNYGAELRVLHRYMLFGQNSHLLIGGRYYKGNTLRKQGDAGKGSNADFTFLNPSNLENSSYLFPSSNYAVFMENIFQFTKNWCVTPGLRYEYINTSSEGYYRLMNKDLAGTVILDKKVYDNRSNGRDLILAGIGTQLKFSESAEIYANFSQNYRSINFNDMRVANPNFQVDPDLKDEHGFTVDGGFRGAVKNLFYFDIGAFMIKYNDRIGTDLRVDPSSYQVVRYRTNIGQSRNMGIEAVVEMDWMKLVNKNSAYLFSTFANFSLIHAVYQTSKKEFFNKTVEFVPNMIIRTGFSYAYKKFGATWQYAYTGEQFSEATNTPTSPTGIYGLIPAYSVMDVSANYTWKNFGVIAGINNLGNAKYFTRRAEGYPGPGIIPADPINYYLTLRVTF